MGRGIARFTLEGVRGARVSTHPFATEDGLGLHLTRFHRADCDDVVLLIHGLTASSDMFIMPEHRNLATFLLDSGYTDVWTLDFRMSCRYPYDTETHRYTLDDIAAWDHPAALRELRRHVGDRRVHVIAHCLGSMSFTMSLFAGLVDVATLTSNAVALTPRVPGWSRWKLAVCPAFNEYVLGLPFVDPRFGLAPPLTRGWILSRAVSLAHRECDVPACHMVSFMWGAGRPGMFNHEKLADVTHERVADLLGGCGVHYYRHIRKMVDAGRTVHYRRRHPALPEDYFANAAEVDTPILFLAGDRNQVFSDSNIVCHRVLSDLVPGRHELEVLPGYGHIDPFIGKDVDVEVFPRIVEHLEKHSVEGKVA